MEQIKTLSKLIDLLVDKNKSEIDEIVSKISIPISEFEKFTNWEEGYYTRNCIVRTDNFELLLICWKPGQKTPIHCHNKQNCWMYIVSGEVTEHQYKFDKNEMPIKIKTSQLESGKSFYINDEIALHQLQNKTNSPCLSLHLYANPIDTCSYFDEESASYKDIKLRYTNEAIK